MVGSARAAVVSATDEVLDLLGDEYAREILAATSERAVSVADLTRAFEMSQPTASRRLNRLADAGLVTEETRIGTDGHHVTVYRAAVEDIDVTVGDGRLTVDVERTETSADRMRNIWRAMRGE